MEVAALAGLLLVMMAALGDGGAEKGAAAMHLADRRWQNVGRRLFDEVAGGADRHHQRDVGIVAVCGKDEHLRVGLHQQNLPRSLHAIERGHGDVHDDHVRRQFLHQFQGHSSVLGLANDFDVFLQLQESQQAFTNDHVILGE